MAQIADHYPAHVTRKKNMVLDVFARAEAEEKSGQSGKQLLEEILRALCLELSPSTLHQVLQQLQTFKVPEKTSLRTFCLSYALQ